MSKGEQTRTVNWIWWVIFPPYAIYRFARYSKKKWFVKIPVLLILFLVTIVAVDLAVAPHRVEEAQAEKIIHEYIKKELEDDSLRKLDRLGVGSSLSKKEKQDTVYYRFLAGEGIYKVGLVANKNNELMVHHIEQLYPIKNNQLNMDNRTSPSVALWLHENKQLVGEPIELLESDENGQKVKTEKTTLEFKEGTQDLYEVYDVDNKKSLLKRENEVRLPDVVYDYLAKSKTKEKVGELKNVLAYDLAPTSEIYYFRTDKGVYQILQNDNGEIVLRKERTKGEMTND